MTYASRLLIAVAAAAFFIRVPPVSAQATTGLEPRSIAVWAGVGFQGDMGGSVNSSGIGIVNNQRAEINSNTWGERYDAAFLVRYGVTVDFTEEIQLTIAGHWEQAEADDALVGLVGNQPLNVKFSDNQGWGFDFGARRFFATDMKAKPFVAGSIGFQRIQEITAMFSGPAISGAASDIPFYDDSWAVQWRFGTGFLWGFTDHLGVVVSLDLKYSGVLSDQAGIGTFGFERINDTGNRWTLPLVGGLYARF